MKKENLSKYQKDIYEGKTDFIPIYHNLNLFKEFFSSQINKTKKYKILGLSLKSIKNLEMIKKLNIKPNIKLLDAGCGPGILLNQLYEIYKIKGYGIDISKKAIYAGKKVGNKNIKLFTGRLEKLPFKNNFFNVIISFDVLEHIEDKEKVLKEIKRVLKPKGKILFYIISKRDFLTWHFILRLFTFGKLGVDKEGGHIRDYFADPFDIKKSLKNLNFEKIKITFFHSFFTLIVDEFLFKIQKNKMQKKENLSTDIKNVKIKVLYKIMKILLFILEFLELPWKLAGLSNGFFIYAEKGEKNG